MLTLNTNLLSRGSKISGCASILGSWQICHNVCTSLVAALATIGIVVQGMPLLFLNRWQMPIWIAAVTLFGVLLLIRVGARMRCITTRGVFGNAGLLMAGAPFAGDWMASARAAGLVVVLLVLLWYVKDLIVRRQGQGIVLDFVEQGRKVAGGLVGVVAVLLLVISTGAQRSGEISSATHMDGVGSLDFARDDKTGRRMKFTLFDVAHAKELMDKNGDGACDSCGMAIAECIESGMMQCTMDPNAKIGLLQSAHSHATFHVYKDGQELDLTSYGHRMGGNDDGKSSSFLHVEGPNFNRLHMHATGVPLQMWFDSVGLVTDGAVVSVNGQKVESGLGYVFEDGEVIEVKF